MNYLERLAKDFNRKQRKQNTNKNFGILLGLGVVIGGSVAVLYARNCCKEIKEIIINDATDINSDDDEINSKRDEIKQTLEKESDESIGDVGAAMEKALEDLEDEKQNENEVAN